MDSILNINFLWAKPLGVTSKGIDLFLLRLSIVDYNEFLSLFMDALDYLAIFWLLAAASWPLP